MQSGSARERDSNRSPIQTVLTLLLCEFVYKGWMRNSNGISSSQSIRHPSTMKTIIFAAIFFVAAVHCMPAEVISVAPKITIEEQSDTRNLDGSSIWSFLNSDGTTREESQVQKQLPGPNNTVVFGNTNKGSTSYTSPEGIKITLSWIADENGFQPVGDHLPTPPPVPEEIARALANLLAEPSNTV